jgi:hypothetical protein
MESEKGASRALLASSKTYQDLYRKFKALSEQLVTFKANAFPPSLAKPLEELIKEKEDLKMQVEEQMLVMRGQMEAPPRKAAQAESAS